MRRTISLAVVALGFLAGSLLQAQARTPGAINSSESCCAIGMRGPSVPANSRRLVLDVTNTSPRDFRHHDGFRHNRFINGFVGYPIYYNPYGYYDTQTPDGSQPAANNYQQPMDDEGPGLTVFERRRSYQLIGEPPGQDQRYGEHYTDAREDRNRSDNETTSKSDKETPAAEPAPEEVVSTILIFRDGSHREVRNYALMGSSIYDLSVKPGQGRMKILLADLDIPATIAANDQRGIEFKLPKQ